MLADLKLAGGLLIFFATLFFIIKGKYSKSLIAMIGGCAMVLIRVIDEEEAIHSVAVNLEILFLLTGLMIIVEIMSESGLFQWLAITAAQFAKGDPLKILLLLCGVTAICSAFLDNVTTILLIVPISILLAKQLKLDPFPFVMSQIFAANIGGTATLIGDPPNLLIGASSGLTFNAFLVNLAPLAIINMVVLLITVTIYCRKDMIVSNELKAMIMELDATRAITDKKLLIQSTTLFFLIIIGFLTNSFSHLGLGVIAIGGSALLMFISKKNPEELYKKVEWETLFFFGGLFVIVDGIDKLGVIQKFAEHILILTAGHKMITSQVILAISTFFSPILGSVPFTLSFIKIINEFIPKFSGDVSIFWWALALGACLGGNMTIFGSACNMVAISIAKKSGIEISFRRYLKFGLFVVIESLILSMIYLYIRY
ncbi:MAG: ArsB/NhaD family transporter [Fusobacteriaceae bacterium]